MKNRWVTLGLLALVCHFVAGCKSVDLINTDNKETRDNSSWWKKDDLPPAESPTKIVAIWANSVFNEPGTGPVRGLGGRVYFYNAKHKPVRVDGELTVFLYDDTNEMDRETQEATKRITFSADEVAEKYTPTEFGPSYSFWLPWDAVGGESAQLSVIPVFNGQSGEMLVGEQARYLLPGKKPNVIAQQEQDDVVPASFENTNGASESLQLKSSTIKLPPSMQRHLRKKPMLSHRQNRVSIRRSTLGSPEPSRATTPSPQESNRAEQRQESIERTFGRRPGVVLEDEVAKPLMEVNPNPNNASSSSPLVDSQRDLLQARTWQSAQQASARDQNLLGRAKSLFGRSP